MTNFYELMFLAGGSRQKIPRSRKFFIILGGYNMNENQEQALLQKYAEIFATAEKPDWAVRKSLANQDLIMPTIPFVGKDYAKQEVKILAYASAENLSKYDYETGSTTMPLADYKVAANRHRIAYDQGASQGFFPFVHIGPMDDGKLATAILYIAEQLKMDIKDVTPREFYERIAFGNFCKYTQESEYQTYFRETGLRDETKPKTNKDYADDLPMLKYSLEFIKADIETLKPDYVIMSKTTYEAINDDFITAMSEHTQFIRIWQINDGNINRLISPQHSGKPYKDTELSDTVRQWTDNINQVNYYKVFEYLDQRLQDCNNTK